MKSSTQVSVRSISTIAREIQGDWVNIHGEAKKSLDAMLSINNLSQDIGTPSAVNTVKNFLRHAANYRTDMSQDLKGELRHVLNVHETTIQKERENSIAHAFRTGKAAGVNNPVVNPVQDVLTGVTEFGDRNPVPPEVKAQADDFIHSLETVMGPCPPDQFAAVEAEIEQEIMSGATGSPISAPTEDEAELDKELTQLFSQLSGQ